MSSTDRSPLPPPSTTGRDESPGLPGFSTWRSVYLTVVVVFIGTVALLALLPQLAR